jgi:hypothetical protein
MDALAALSKASGQGRHLTMAEKEQMKEFDHFSRALTGSLPSRMARGDETASAYNPGKYLHKAALLRAERNREESRPKSPLPANIQTLVDLQIKKGKTKGQWKASPALRKALGGYIPEPQFGMNKGSWTTAVVLSFLRRHPKLYDKTIDTYTRGSIWVSDNTTLNMAGDSLPPLKGSWKDLVDQDPEKAKFIGDSGKWKECVTYNAENFGYLPFSKEERNRLPGGSMPSPADQSMGEFPFIQDQPPRDSFTREAEQRMAARIAAEATKMSRFKTDAEYEAEEREQKRRRKREDDWKWRQKALTREFKMKSRDPGKAFLVGERVKTKYRRASEWDRPRMTEKFHPARIIRLGADGQSVDLKYLDKRREVERRVKKSVVEADMIEFARMSIEINKRNFDKKMKAKAIQDEKDKFEAELMLLKEAQRAKGGDINKLEEEARAQLEREERAKKEMERQKQLEVEEEEMRLHEGLDSIATEWVEPMSLRGEKKRLKKFMVIKKPGFDTRACGQVNAGIDTLTMRRDHTDLREKARKRRVVKKEKSMSEIIAAEQAAAAAQEKAALAKVGENQKARVVAGGKKNEVIRRQFEEEQRKQRAILKGLIDGVTQAEDNVVECMLKHESNVLSVKDEMEKAVDRHARAALQTEQIHAFDDLTKTINEGRNINLDLIEAVAAWRESKVALASHRGEKLPETVEYDKDEDEECEELGPLRSPSAPPFIWNGNNILFKIINDFDFLDNCHQLKEWYGPDFPLLTNPFMLAVPVWERAPTPRKATQTVLVNGVGVERIIPRLRERSERQAKAMKAKKLQVAKSAWWWPGKGIKPSEYERVRRGEKEIFDERRREKIRW